MPQANVKKKLYVKNAGEHIPLVFVRMRYNTVLIVPPPYLALELEYLARKKEAELLKWKSDQHLPISEARRYYSKKFTTKSYAETM